MDSRQLQSILNYCYYSTYVPMGFVLPKQGKLPQIRLVPGEFGAINTFYKLRVKENELIDV